jgi:multicomponent Na+:H+ antiporter subunit B
MTDSIFLKFLARLMMPVLILFSLFLLLRGHNQPGGGFIGGLVGAGSIVLMVLAYGADEVRERLRIDFLRSMLYGVLIAAIAGAIGLALNEPFQDALWWKPIIQGIGRLELGTPLLFDIGVYIAVLSVTSSLVMNLAEEGERSDH